MIRPTLAFIHPTAVDVAPTGISIAPSLLTVAGADVLVAPQGIGDASTLLAVLDPSLYAAGMLLLTTPPTCSAGSLNPPDWLGVQGGREASN